MGPESKWKLSPLCTDLNETRGSGSEDSIFQIIPRTLIEEQIKSTSQRSKFEKCKAVCSVGTTSGLIGVAVDKELLIFDDKVENVVQTLPFSCPIDIVIWNRCLLLVGLSSSEIHFLHPSTFELLDTRTAEESAGAIVSQCKEERFYVDGHIRVEDGSCELHVISVEGIVYRFQTPVAPDNTLDYTRLEKTICASSLTQTFSRATIGTKQMVTSCHFVAPSFTYLADKSGNISLLQLLEDAEGKAETLASNNIVKVLSQNPKVVKVKKMTRCEGLLFALLSSGSLEILFDDILTVTKPLKLPIPNTKVHDFAVVLCDQDIKLWAIFGDYQNAEITYVGVFSGTSFKPKLYVQVPVCFTSSGTDLNESFKMDSFSVRFNEQSVLTEQPNSFICTTSEGVMIFQVLESSVESTLQRFLSLGKYEQASAFAAKYSFNVDIVKKARVQAYYNELSTLKSDRKIEHAFQQLLLLLDTISDMDFVCKFCICDENSLIPKVDWVRKIVNLGCKKSRAKSGTEYVKKLLVLGKKFYTFEQVFPNGTIQDWKTFCVQSNSMFEICRRFLKNEQFSYCNCVWNRHSTEFLHELELGDLVEFFWTLFSKQIDTTESESLFKTILADALDKCVEDDIHQERGLRGIMDLIKKQICFLEQRISWPVDAIKFVKTLMNTFKSEVSKLHESTRHDLKLEDKVVFCRKLIRGLEFYLQSLQEVSDLINAHSMRIPFHKIIQDDINEVVNAMLDELFSREEIQVFVQKFLRPFATRKNQSIDFLFENYIESVVSYVPVYASASCIPFEERLVSLVELISNVESKLNAVYLMATNWPVPWTAGIESIVNRMLDMIIGYDLKSRNECLRLQGVIANIQKQVPFECLLQKYRLFASKLTNPAGIKIAILRILRSEKSDAYVDCQELVKFTGKLNADDVLALKLQLELEREDFAGEVEDVFPEDLSLYAANKLMNFFLILSSNSPENNIFQTQEVARWQKAADYLSKKLNAWDEIEFLSLQTIAPNITKLSILFDPSYPFVIIEHMLLNLMKLSVDEIMERSKRLSTISYHPHHEIIVAIVFTMMGQQPQTTKIWGLLEKLVHIPCALQAPILEDYVIVRIPDLIFQMPSLSTEQQLVLESFLKLMINSFDKSFTDLSKYMAVCGIFMALREHEVPLENEYLLLIKDPLSGIGKKISHMVEELESLSLGLIKYGEHDLMVRIINNLILHHQGVAIGIMEPQVKSYCAEAIRQVSEAKKALIEQSLNYRESEPNQRVLKLVKSLCDAGFYVNAYSLRNRNKRKLIKNLLRVKEFSLACDVALVFEYREENEWSEILKGFMEIGDIKPLMALLNDIKNITELWVIPEFSSAWVMVSETHPEFQNLCPIVIFV